MLRAWAVFYIGNFIGGGALVRGAYWFIYLRRLLRLFAKSQLLPRRACRSLERRADVLTVLGIRVHVLQPVHQHDTFRPEHLSHLIHFLRQFFDFLGVFFLVGLLDLVV
jgi:hypothetical protein